MKEKDDNLLNPVYVTNRNKISLLPPSAIDFPINTYQLIEGQFGKNSFTMMAYIELSEEGIFISLLNDFGTDMGVISYDGQKVYFESPYFPKNLKGEYVISDIQNVYYNTELLKTNYEKAGLQFICGADYRQILNGNKVIEEIKFNEQSVTIKNFLRDYEYNLVDGGIVE